MRTSTAIGTSLLVILGAACEVGQDGDVIRNPHSLYPGLDLDALPGNGGGALGVYEPPAAPVTTRTVRVGGNTTEETYAQVTDACSTPGTEVILPALPHTFGLTLRGVQDCDVFLEPGARIGVLQLFASESGEPARRVRIRGGTVLAVVVGTATDVILDGVTVDAGPFPRWDDATPIILSDELGPPVNRFALVNSMVRAVTPASDDNRGFALWSMGARNVLVANNNIVTGGNERSWAFRLSGGDNYVIVDNTIRVSSTQLIGMDSALVDYVYAKGGTWMHQGVAPVDGAPANDSFRQLDDAGSDNVFIHDPDVYLLSDQPVAFGASAGPGQADKAWQVRKVHWHARAAAIVSETRLNDAMSICGGGDLCDYGAASHTYSYDEELAFPTNPWRDLPGFAEDNPDNLPVGAP